MNNSEKYSNSLSELSREEQEQLLRELLPKLGLDPAAPGSYYRSKVRKRIFFTRLAAVCAAALLLAAAAIWLLTPPAFRNVRQTGGPEAATVEFSVSRAALLEGVTAELDGGPAEVEQLGPGDYRLTLEKNGELTITARTVTGRETSKGMTVSGIDMQPPQVRRDEVADGDMYIYFIDEGGSGVNWQSVTAVYADTDQPLEELEVDGAAGFVRFPFPEQSVRVYVEDNHGNPLSVRMTVLQSPSAAEEDAP